MKIHPRVMPVGVLICSCAFPSPGPYQIYKGYCHLYARCSFCNRWSVKAGFTHFYHGQLFLQGSAIDLSVTP